MKRGALQLLCEGVTHVGRRRDANEDAFLMLPDAGLLAVADGMGGHAAGEVAARITVETLRESLGRPNGEGERAAESDEAAADRGRLRRAIELANNRIFETIESRQELRGMGTTVVVALVRGERLIVGYVGDSRAYLLQGGALRQLTSDHSWVQEQVALGLLSPAEAHRHPFRNIVTRALGSRENVSVDLCEEKLGEGDALLLCSDGLNSMVEDETIARILRGAAGEPALACRQLVEAANLAGGEDNVTVIVARAGRG